LRYYDTCTLFNAIYKALKLGI